MTAPRLSLLTPSDREYLRDQTLKVLESVGARFESAKARRLLAEGGCLVDDETQIVRMPRDLVERSIAALRRPVLLAARDPRQDVVLDGSRTYLTTAGICPFVVDRETGRRREPTLRDLAEAGRMVDALAEIGLVWFPISPTAGVPDAVSRGPHQSAAGVDLLSLGCLLQNTGKHIQGQLVRPDNVPLALEMLRLAAPDEDLRERPIFSSLYCPVSPLRHEAEAVEAGMEMAKAHIPIDIFSLALAGATSPMTLAGTVIQTIAEELSATVLFKLVDSDCPLLLSSNAGIMDMQTSRFATSTPETLLMNAALIDLVHSLGAPTLCVGHVSDAFPLGFRAGLEDMAYALFTRLARPDVMIGLGTLEAGQAFSFAKLVLDAEVAQHNERILQGLVIDDEHAAIEAIAAVGPGGQFLNRKETRRHLRSGEYWRPQMLQRAPHEDWLAGAPDEVARAAAAVEEMLATHEPLPLPDGAAEAIAAVLGGA